LRRGEPRACHRGGGGGQQHGRLPRSQRPRAQADMAWSPARATSWRRSGVAHPRGDAVIRQRSRPAVASAARTVCSSRSNIDASDYVSASGDRSAALDGARR
jgi:hypothetical protein